ncbi:hypothetical protein QBC35DRAFT_342542, partial [Podospora australis]
CFAIPGDEQWPSPSEWAELNKTVGGRLIAARPLAAVCHTGDPFNVYDESKCAEVKAGWDRPETHFVDPVEFNTPIFQNASCDPFTPAERVCDLGNYVSYAINLTMKTAVRDVQAGLEFARRKGVRVVVKNTGHDYLGKSTGKGALSFWTHNLRERTVIEDYKSKDYQGPAIKLGAGMLTGEAYETAREAGYRVVGGSCPTVGIAGGYAQGGGHSSLASLYGLAADNVLEWEVVTPEGEHVVATPTGRYKDLYWALSGGGGGTFGVVISMTARLHPDGIVGGASFSFTAPMDKFWDAVESFHRLGIRYIDAGNSMIYMLRMLETNTPILIAFSVTVPGKNETGVKEAMQPFLDDLKGRDIAYNFESHVSQTFLDHFARDFGPLPYGMFPVSQITGSRLLPRSAIQDTESSKAVTEALKLAVESEGFYLGCNLFNAGVVRPKNAVNPAFRESVSHCIVVGPWDFTLPRGFMLERQRRLTEVIQPALDEATRGSGTYLNEGNSEQGDWREQFYGEDVYKRLKKVKERYDPGRLFYARTAVGSE